MRRQGARWRTAIQFRRWATWGSRTRSKDVWSKAVATASLRLLLPTTTTNFDFPTTVEATVLDIRSYRYPFGRPSSAPAALCSRLQFLDSLSQRRCFCFLLEDCWRRRVLLWMIRIRAGSLTPRDGVMATTAPGVTLSQTRHNHYTEHGTSTSDSVVYMYPAY